MSLLAESKAQQPYPPSLTDDEDPSEIFTPEDSRIFGFVEVLSEIETEQKTPLILSISANKEFLTLLVKEYQEDSWTRTLTLAASGMPNLRNQNGLWFLDKRLVIPNTSNL
jgi:hypothetical protein